MILLLRFANLAVTGSLHYEISTQDFAGIPSPRSTLCCTMNITAVAFSIGSSFFVLFTHCLTVDGYNFL